MFLGLIVMKIRLLCENAASDMVWLAEWGFSALITFEGGTVLFDTGFSDVWQKNADHAGVDLNDVDAVAISHFHRDHTRGLLYHRFSEPKKLIVHPRVLSAVLKTDKAEVKKDYADIQAVMQRDFEIVATREPREFLPRAWFLGEVPRVMGFERGMFEDDAMEDDTALAFRTRKGAVVVSGCSHAGICNICEHAKQVTGQPLHAVIGGFHLMKSENPPIDETIAYFKAEAPELLLPMHCVDFAYQAKFHNVFGCLKYGAGDVIEV